VVHDRAEDEDEAGLGIRVGALLGTVADRLDHRLDKCPTDKSRKATKRVGRSATQAAVGGDDRRLENK